VYIDWAFSFVTLWLLLSWEFIMHAPSGDKTDMTNEIPVFDSDIIVDIVFDRGLFFIVVKNLCEKPAFKVSIRFDKKIFGIEGTKNISSMLLFKNIEFLAPKKEIATFLDTSFSYFKSRQPEKIAFFISYIDASGKKRTGIIHHDLGIYRDFGYVNRTQA
jgi:hypothetical protein